MFRFPSRPAGFTALILASLVVAGACTSAGATAPPTALPTSAPTAAPSVAPSPPASDGSTGDVARGMGWNSFDPCTLLPEDVATSLVGALEGAPKAAAGESGGTRCTWTGIGADAATLTIETADPETFEALRESASEPQDVPGLGSGA